MDAGGLNQITQPFLDALQSDAVVINKWAMSLFYYLAVIQLAYVAIWSTISGEGLGRMINKFVSLAFVLGIFYGCLSHGEEWMSQIINGFIELGQAGGTVEINPSSVMGLGFKLCKVLITGIFKWGLLAAIFVALLACAMSVALSLIFALIAAELIVVLVKSYFLISLSSLFFAFGGCDVTRDMTVRYFQSAIGIGLQLMTLYFLIGIGLSLGNKWLDMITDAMDKQQMLPILIVFANTIVYYLIVKNIPVFIASLAGAGKFRNYGDEAITSAVTAGTALAGAGLALMKNLPQINMNMPMPYPDFSNMQFQQDKIGKPVPRELPPPAMTKINPNGR